MLRPLLLLALCVSPAIAIECDKCTSRECFGFCYFRQKTLTAEALAKCGEGVMSKGLCIAAPGSPKCAKKWSAPWVADACVDQIGCPLTACDAGSDSGGYAPWCCDAGSVDCNSWHYCTPPSCADEWSKTEFDENCVDIKGCPSKACDGHDTPWCCDAGSVDCDSWHYCTPTCPDEWSKTDPWHNCIPTPPRCAAEWSDSAQHKDCVDIKGCPSKACDGHEKPWCCDAGSVDCDSWHYCTPHHDRTPPQCAAEWSSPEFDENCVDIKGCPSKACDGYEKPWCCDAGSVDCDSYHYCTPTCADEWSNTEFSKNCVDIKGCPSKACDGHDTPWCCDSGSVDCDSWHYCTPTCPDEWSKTDPWHHCIPTPPRCAAEWSDSAQHKDCVDIKGCPSKACDGHEKPWCCDAGSVESVDCDSWHYCIPDANGAV